MMHQSRRGLQCTHPRSESHTSSHVQLTCILASEMPKSSASSSRVPMSGYWFFKNSPSNFLSCSGVKFVLLRRWGRGRDMLGDGQLPPSLLSLRQSGCAWLSLVSAMEKKCLLTLSVQTKQSHQYRLRSEQTCWQWPVSGTYLSRTAFSYDMHD